MNQRWRFLFCYIAAQPASAREITPYSGKAVNRFKAGIGFKKVIALQHDMSLTAWTISNSLQTNATLLNDARCRLFHDNNFALLASVLRAVKTR